MKRGAAVLALVAAASLTTATSAPATFRTGGGGAADLGVFKVTGGHFVQEVSYTARYRSVEGAYGDCYVIQYQDDGDTTFNLSFDPGSSAQIVNRAYAPGDLHTELSFERPDTYPTRRAFPKVSGAASRDWTPHPEVVEGPSYDPGACGPPPEPPFQSTAGCGTEIVSSWTTGMNLLGAGRGNLDAILNGPVLTPDPVVPCPSDSVYGTTAAPALSGIGKAELLDADPGETVKIGARSDWSHSGEEGLFIPFQFISGAQNLRQDWELQLVKTRCGTLGCDDARARFRGAPDRVERKMKRAIEEARKQLQLKPSLKVFLEVGSATKARAAAQSRRKRLGLACGRGKRGIGGVFLQAKRKRWQALLNSGAIEEARVSCVKAAGD
jgi:hypothetical protein